MDSHRIKAKLPFLIVVLGLCLIAFSPSARAQLDTAAEGASEARSSNIEDRTLNVIDTKVESIIGEITSYVDKVRLENFPLYLTSYSAIVGAAIGFTISLLGYRLSDPRSDYTQLRRRGSLLAMTCGAASGVLLAVIKAPADLDGKLTVLLLSITSGAAVGWVMSLLTFIVQRYRSSLLAIKEGRIMSQRIGRR